MVVQTVRFRYDRKTGDLMSRTVLDEYDIDEDKYGEMAACAITGLSLNEIVRELSRAYPLTKSAPAE